MGHWEETRRMRLFRMGRNEVRTVVTSAKRVAMMSLHVIPEKMLSSSVEQRG